MVGEWLREFRDKGQGPRAKGQRPRAKGSSLSPYPLALSPKVITTPNPEIIVAAQSDPELMKALQEADLSIPDGVGVVWALRLLGPKAKGSSLSPYPLALSRLSGTDLMESLILQPQKVAPCELHPLKVMLLGGRPGVAAKAARKCHELWVMGCGSGVSHEDESPDSPIPSLPNSQLTTHNSQLKIRALSGPPDIQKVSPFELNQLIAQINSFSPDLLFVAFGHPKQEKWLSANRYRLNAGVAMAVGGAFDQLANPALRPPPYINSIGLGWLYRLLRQPWRVKRQLALVKFAGMVIAKIINSQ